MRKVIIIIVLPLALFISWLACAKSNSSKRNTDPATSSKDSLFYNPLLSSGADPWVYKKGNVFYYMATNGVNITILKTTAISALAQAPAKTVWSPPASGPDSKNIWAPELHYLNQKWYLYYSAGASADLSTQRCFVLENTADDPLTGQWTDKGKIGDPDADFFSIDGSVFEYKGKLYFIWSGTASDKDNIQRIYIAEMENPWTLKTHRVQISMPEYSWEKTGGQVNEGPEALINPSGDLFIIFSVSQCATDDYGLGQLRLKPGGDPLHPADWTKQAVPVFSKSIQQNVFGPGHNGFFKSKDDQEDWIIYHANSASGQGCGGTRSPRIQKFTWKADGAPSFGEPVSVAQQQRKQSGE